MSDSDWEKEDFEPPTFTKPVLGDRWEGEDEDDVKENWDDEEAEKSENAENAENADEDNPDANAVVPPQTKKKKSLNQMVIEKEEKKRKEKEEKQAEELVVNENCSPEDIYAEKIKQAKLQEDADLELAKDAFGVTDQHSQGTIDSMAPVTKEDFDNFRKALVNKIVDYEKSIHYMPFLEDFLREVCLTMEPEDIKKLSSAMNAVANEKVKAQKTAKHKKKTNKGRAALNVGKGDDYHLNEYGDEYDDFI